MAGVGAADPVVGGLDSAGELAEFLQRRGELLTCGRDELQWDR